MEILTLSGEPVTSYLTATPQIPPDLPSSETHPPQLNRGFDALLLRGCNKKYLHWKLRRTVENIYFRLITLLLIALDISFIIVEIAISCAGDSTVVVIRNLEMALSVYFLFEVRSETIFCFFEMISFSNRCSAEWSL